MTQAYLVGSMRLDSAETVSRAVAANCGDGVSCIHSDETGSRAGSDSSRNAATNIGDRGSAATAGRVAYPLVTPCPLLVSAAAI